MPLLPTLLLSHHGHKVPEMYGFIGSHIGVLATLIPLQTRGSAEAAAGRGIWELPQVLINKILTLNTGTHRFKLIFLQGERVI